ncbi:MAG: thioredoxin-disulfide reductase [Bacteroidota bacterium]|nr:thioredoxin-disulfide reductase [Bacteroidota bacterium]
MAEQENIKCLIIGSGPAGYTAAIYAARADLNPVVYEGMEPGGQLTTTTEVDNFPGYPTGITGPDMMQDLRKQALRFNTDIRTGFIKEADFSERPFKLKADDGKEIIAETVIIATGATARYLGLESEQKFKGGGVSACATCDGFFYKGLDVIVVGGGDTAAEEATYLANMVNKVYMIHRRDELRASKAMQTRVLNTKNIEVVWDSVVKEVVGEESAFMKKVTGARIENVKTGEEKIINVDGFFLGIGHKPNTELFKNQLDMDNNGYIITQPDTMKTNIPGVFAAGDVQDPHYRQAITSAGSGAIAAIDAERFLGDLEAAK